MHMHTANLTFTGVPMQDMPEGMHGIFPVLHKGKVYIAGGGTQAAASISQLVYEYTLA
jgi:hypothetical protein